MGVQGVQERFWWRWGRQGNRSECQTFCDPMACSLPGSSIHRIFQARVLDRVTISFSRGSSWPKDWTQILCIAGRRFTIWATREARYILDIQVSPASCRTKRGKEDLGQGSASFVIGLLFLIRVGYPYPLHLLPFDFNGDSTERVYWSSLEPMSVFAIWPKSEIRKTVVFSHIVLVQKM